MYNYHEYDPYYTNVCSTAKLGELMAKIVTAIRQEFSNIEYIHGIGHSLGAHILGNIEKFGNVKLDRISGLDPTGPCFEDQSSDVRFNFGSWGLTDSSADFVDIIHTDGLAFGTSLPKGHLDFYAGDPSDGERSVGGGLQPTCEGECFSKEACCHLKAIEYYSRSIDDPESLKTSYKMKCDTQTCGGWRTDYCRHIGDSDAQVHTYAGYFSSMLPEKIQLYLPIIGNGSTWYGPCDQSLDYAKRQWCSIPSP